MSLYKENSGTAQAIANHFAGCNFQPPLESYVNIDEYIKKIMDNAYRFEVWEGDELAGMVAVYCNDLESQQSFVTMVSVMSKHSGKGIAKDLLSKAVNHCKDRGFKTMSLEVRSDNEGAIHVYEKQGFTAVGEADGMIKMSLALDQ